MIEAGAAGVHFEDQLASVKKCGHMGGKVLVPTQEAVQKLVAARLAADVADVPTIVLARTDANAADLMTSDFDPNDEGSTVSAETLADMRALNEASQLLTSKVQEIDAAETQRVEEARALIEARKPV